MENRLPRAGLAGALGMFGGPEGESGRIEQGTQVHP